MNQPSSERYVLCVDDDYEFLKSLEFFLPEQINRHGGGNPSYRFIFFAEASEALDAIRELIAGGETVAMLITDQQMPNMKGTEFLTLAREIVPESTRILLTGHSGIEAAIVAINEQLLDKYLTKPIESEHDFMLSVKQLLERFELQRRVAQQNSLIQGLYGFANTLNAADSLDDTLNIVVGFTKSGLGCESVEILLGPPPDPSDGGRQAAEGRSQGTREAARPRAMSGLVHHVKDCPGFDELMAESHLPRHAGGIAYAVLESGGRDLGLILATGSSDGSAFTEESLNRLGYIAASASVAIQKQRSRARLEEIAQARGRRLEEAQTRLQILDRLKSDFLNFVSHELRTPLNHIAAVDMIDENMDQVSLSQVVAIVRNGYERLEHFIMSSLEYFEWFTPRLENCDEVTDLTRLVHAAIGRDAEKQGKRVQWELGIPTEPCPALIPWTHADHLLTILVDNAVKFSIGEPRVRLELALVGDWATLNVTDYGKGFPPAWAKEVFRPFTITDSMHHQEGTALNLAKAAAMVEAYGGHIYARSAGENQGATFTVELPARVEERARVIELRNATSDDDRDSLETRAA